MPTAQRQQADDAAQPLCSRELLQHVGNRCLGALLQDCQHVGLQGSEVDFRLCDQFAHRLKIDGRRVSFCHLPRQCLQGWVVQHPLRQGAQPTAREFQRVLEGLSGPDFILQAQCCALSVFQQVIESALLEVFTTLDEVLQAAREGLEHLVNHAALLKKGARQPQKESSLLGLELPHELPRHNAIKCLIKRGRLFWVRKQAPESRESPSGVAL